MANMAYCRFQNTAADLFDCMEHLDDNDLPEAEAKAREQIIRYAKQIAAEFGEDA